MDGEIVKVNDNVNENASVTPEVSSSVDISVNCACADNSEEFITGQDIAKMFKVSNSTVNLWKRQGMPFFGKSSCARFTKSEVTLWQREQSKLPITKGKRKRVAVIV